MTRNRSCIVLPISFSLKHLLVIVMERWITITSLSLTDDVFLSETSGWGLRRRNWHLRSTSCRQSFNRK